MPNIAPGFGPGGFETSGGPQVMGAEEKLASMMQMMQGAPNSVLMMISRILQSGGGAGPQQAPASNTQMMPQQQWESLYQMPPARGPIQMPGVNSGMAPAPMRPSEPPVYMDPNPGFIRG